MNIDSSIPFSGLADKILDLPQSAQSLFDTVSSGKILDLPQSVQSILDTVTSSTDLQSFLFDAKSPLNDPSAFAALIDAKGPAVWNALEVLAANPLTLPLFLLGTFTSVIGGAGTDDSKVGSPYDAGLTAYDYKKADLFYGSRPGYVIRRLLKLGQITGAFNMKLLIDWRTGNLEKNEEIRAKEALELVTQMGPTYIKLGQALSIRTDLIPKSYALELRQLQDAVPPFETAIAKEIIRKELGLRDLSEKFTKISDKPIASASIGQVYKGTLKDGREVAVKVQRPRIIDAISLDLFILRILTPFQVWVSNAVSKRKTEQADIDVGLALVDEWGRGFVAEVDYNLEAKNTKDFLAAMQSRGLDAVTAPTIVDELSGEKVIVTEWIEGTRLDLDASPDVPRLCGVANNAYLTMLLDTGVLHCDPHPGNLLRTKDGKLCILDWGMTLPVPRDLQYSLLEFIAHVNTEDYDAIPQDFINMEFSPQGKLDELERSGMTESLSFALRQLSKGGGPAKMQKRVIEELNERYGGNLSVEEIRVKAREEMMEKMQQRLEAEGVNINGVTDMMEEMSRRNRELFRLPPYVLYVTRAFSTLEGIGLSVNSDYSLLQESYPYLARRLMTDESPRGKEALKTMLFGGSKGTGISLDKLVEMTDGFSNYTASTTAVDQQGLGASQAQSDLVDIILSPDGNQVQDVLLEGVASAADSLLRTSYDRVRKTPQSLAVRAAVKAPTNLVNRIIPKPLRPLALPITLPYRVISTVDRLIEKKAEDEENVKALQKTIEALRSTASSSAGSSGSDMNADLPYLATRFNTGASSGNEGGQGSLQGGDARPSGLGMANVVRTAVQEQLRQPDSILRSTIDDPSKRAKVVGTAFGVSRRLTGTVFKRAAQRFEQIATEETSAEHAGEMSADNTEGLGIQMGSGDRADPFQDREDDLLSKEMLKSIGKVYSKRANDIADALNPPRTK